MKHYFLFILMFGSFSMCAYAQQVSTKKAPYTLPLKMNFGKNPGCNAGKGVCSLVIDDNTPLKPKQIHCNAYRIPGTESLMLTFSLSEFKNYDPINEKLFFDDNDIPKEPKRFDYCYIIGSRMGLKLGLEMPSPGINSDEPYEIQVDGDMVTMTFQYSDVLSCTN